MRKLLGWGLGLALIATGCTASRTVIVHERTAPPPPAEAETPGLEQASRMHTRNGIRFYKRGHYRKAIQQFEVAIAQDSDNWEAHFYLAECYRELSDFDRCLAHYHKVRDLQDDPHWTARVEFGIGVVFERRGDLRNARHHFELALVSDAGFEPAKRGCARLAAKRFKDHDEDDDDDDDNHRHNRGHGKKHDD